MSQKRKRCKHCGSSKTRPGERTCFRCYRRIRREKDPVKAKFYDFRWRCQLRGISFSLTIEQFRKLAEESGYSERAGTDRNGLHIDRIDPREGYHPGNVQVLKCSENSRKGAVQDKEILNGGDEPAPF